MGQETVLGVLSFDKTGIVAISSFTMILTASNQSGVQISDHHHSSLTA